jgi:hypothetical protein
MRKGVAAQQERMQTIWREFDDSVRAIVSLFETEVRAHDAATVRCVGADKTTGAPGASVDRPKSESPHDHNGHSSELQSFGRIQT